MTTDIASLGLRVEAMEVRAAQQDLRRLTEEAGRAEQGSRRLTGATSVLAEAVKAAVAAYASWKIAEHIKEMAMLAARYETLGVVMRIAGNNAGYTNVQMLAYEKALQKTGISMTQSRNSLIQMATASINLANATKLARAAQDLAVVGNINSSEALGRMTNAIQSGEVEILKTMGMNVKWETGYVRLALSLHKNKDDLTEQERVLSRTNTVMKESIKFQGIYEEAMGTAGKQINSLTRYWDDMKLKMGEAFLPPLTLAVHDLTEGLKAANTELDKAGSVSMIDSIGKGLGTAFRYVYEAVVVLGANIGFVFNQLGTGIGGAAAQAQAFLSGDWKNIGTIRSQMVTDLNAQRLALDAFEGKILKVGEEAVVSTEAEAKAIAEKNVVMAEAERVRIKAGEASRAQAILDDKAAKAATKAAEEQKKFDEQYKGLIKSIHEKIAEMKLDDATQGKLTDGQKLAGKILEDLHNGELKLSAAKKAKLNVMMGELLAVEKLHIEHELIAKARQETAAADITETAALYDRIDALNTEIDTYGMSAAAITRRTIAKMKEQLVYTEMGDAEAKALQAKIDLLDQVAVREGKLSTMNLAKKEAEEATAAWKKTFEEVRTGLTDALMRGFEKGKSLAENFRDTLRDMFKTLILRPTIQGILSPISSGISSMMGTGVSASGAVSGAGSLLSSLGTAGSLYTAYQASSLGQFMSGASGSATAASEMMGGAPLTAAARAGQMTSNSLSGAAGTPYLGLAGGGLVAYGSAQRIGGFGGAVAGGALGAGTVAAGGAVAGAVSGAGMVAGATTALAAIPVWGWAALGAAAIVGGMQKGPEKNTRLTFGSNNTAGNISINERGNEGKRDAYIGGTKESSTGALGTFGVTSSFWMSSGQPVVQEFIKSVTQTDDALAQFMTATEKAAATTSLTGHTMVSRSGAEGTDPNGQGGLDAVFGDRIKTIFNAIDPSLNRLIVGFKGTSQELATEATALLSFRSALKGAGEEVFGVKVTLDQLAALKLPTESVSAALGRVTAEFTVTNAVALSMGKTAQEAFGTVGLSSLAARETLVSAAGGLDSLANKAGNFAQDYLTEQQRTAPILKQVTDSMASLGYSSITTRDQFRDLVLGLNLADASQAKLYSSLMDLSSGFAATHEATAAAAVDARTQADILTERKNLQKQLDEATMTEAQLSAQRRAELDDTNRSLYDQVQAANKAKAAQDAAKESLTGVIDKMKSFAESTRALRTSLLTGSLSTLSPAQQYVEMQRSFQSVLEKARAGDTTAQGNFSSSATSFLTASQTANASGTQYQSDYQSVLRATDEMATWATSQVDVAQASLDALNSQVLGITDLNATMLQVQQGIANLPAAMTAAPAIDYGTVGTLSMAPLVDEIKALRGEVIKLRGEMADQTAAKIKGAYDSTDKAADKVSAAVSKTSTDSAWSARNREINYG